MRRFVVYESIRQPSYDFIQDTLSSTYSQMSVECGVGCRARMQTHLENGLEANWDKMIRHIRSLVTDAVGDLMDFCCDSLESFSTNTSSRIEGTLEQVRLEAAQRDRETGQRRLETVNAALVTLTA